MYNARIPRAQQILGVERTVHTAEHLASAMFWLGAPMGEIPRAKLAVNGDQDKSETTGARAEQGGRPTHAQPYAVIHAVAATAEKTWMASGFVAVAEHLQQSGITPVLHWRRRR